MAVPHGCGLFTVANWEALSIALSMGGSQKSKENVIVERFPGNVLVLAHTMQIAERHPRVTQRASAIG